VPAGQPFDFSVVAQDANGATLTNYTSQVQWYAYNQTTGDMVRGCGGTTHWHIAPDRFRKRAMVVRARAKYEHPAVTATAGGWRPMGR
jgi:hypothetical protein